MPVVSASVFCVSKRSTFCGSTGNSSGNYQETETCMVRARHTPRQPLQNHPSGHLGGKATPWSAEKCWMDNIEGWTSLPMQELLRGASSRKGWKKTFAESSLISLRRPNRSRDWNELNVSNAQTETCTPTPTTVFCCINKSIKQYSFPFCLSRLLLLCVHSYRDRKCAHWCVPFF